MSARRIAWLAAVALVAAASSARADRSHIVVPLEPAGGSGGDVSGTATFTSRDHVSTFIVKIRGAEPDTLLALQIGGAEITTVETDSGGDARFLFQERGLDQGTPRRGRSGPLNFDPRGEEIVIGGPNGAVLSALFGPGDDPGIQIVDTHVIHESNGGAISETTFRQKRGARSLDVRVDGADDGELGLFVDGRDRGSLESADGRAETSLSDGSKSAGPLDFDAFGQSFEIRSGSDVVLSGTLMSDASIEGAAGGTGSGGTPEPPGENPEPPSPESPSPEPPSGGPAAPM